MTINLDLLQYSSSLKTKKENGKRYIFCQIRQKYLVLQPEEFVRQLLIWYFIHEKKYKQAGISVEKSLKVIELDRRLDILIYDQHFKPFLLVECKAPEVKITLSTFEQIARYNLPLKVPFLLVSNGHTSYCSQMDYEKESFEFLADIPSLKRTPDP